MKFIGGLVLLLATCSLTYAASDFPLYQGVSLQDLANVKSGLTVEQGRAEVTSALSYVSHDPDFQLKKVLSVSLVELDKSERIVTLDVLGRDSRFSTVERDGLGGLGFIRAQVMLNAPEPDGTVSVAGHKIILQRDFYDLRPTMNVSIRERLAVITDAETGFRRIVPLGVGAIDQIQYKGVTTTMTPTMEFGFLTKNTLFRKRDKPKYYRGRPYVDVMVANKLPKTGQPIGIHDTGYGFHIWQDGSFMRGYLSHGCLRMRDADLDELLQWVLGAHGMIPLHIRAENYAEGDHPYPMLKDKHRRVKNYGTAEHPAAKVVKDDDDMWMVDTEWAKVPPPSDDKITGRYQGPRPPTLLVKQ